MKHLFIAMMFGLLAVSAAYADAPTKILGEATLATPLRQVKEFAVKHVAWRCDGEKCVGTGSSARDWQGLDVFMTRCTKVAASAGPLASFSSGGRVADKSDIATCNRLAKK